MKKPSKSKANNPNDNYAMYEADRIAKAIAQPKFPSILQSAENDRRLQLNDRPESERQILRCAPPFDSRAEHENDLRYESRVDYESWLYDGGPTEREDV